MPWPWQHMMWLDNGCSTRKKENSTFGKNVRDSLLVSYARFLQTLQPPGLRPKGFLGTAFGRTTAFWQLLESHDVMARDCAIVHADALRSEGLTSRVAQD